MRRSVLSWHTALGHLPDKPVAVVKKLRAKIEAATRDQPLSAMIEIPVGAAEVEIIERAISDAYTSRERDRQARSTN